VVKIKTTRDTKATKLLFLYPEYLYLGQIITMKLFIRMGCFAVLFYLQGCSGCIKHNGGQDQTSGANGKSGIPVPVTTNNLIINDVNDLTGYWAGEFGPEKADTVDYDDGDEQYDTINISLDEIDGTTVKGHTVLAGKVRFFTCTMVNKGAGYYFTFKGGANEKTTGVYKFSIARGDSLLKGSWNPHSNKIPTHDFELTKKLFKYNPDVKLVAGRYVDYKKTKVVTEKIDTDTYTNEKYATTTNDIDKYNASAELLTKDQIANLKKADLLILRNSIFARHGYIFKKEPLDLYFSQQPWYVPVNTDVIAELTDTEKKNINLLMRYEKNAQEYYDSFGR
jgi:hypothetical protein